MLAIIPQFGSYPHLLKKISNFRTKLATILSNDMFSNQKPHSFDDLINIKKKNIDTLELDSEKIDNNDLLKYAFNNKETMKQTEILTQWCEGLQLKIYKTQEETSNLACIEKVVLEQLLDFLTISKETLVIYLYSIFSPMFDVLNLPHFKKINERVTIPILNKYDIQFYLYICSNNQFKLVDDNSNGMSFIEIYDDKFHIKELFIYLNSLLTRTNSFISNADLLPLLDFKKDRSPYKFNYYTEAVDISYYENAIFNCLRQFFFDFTSVQISIYLGTMLGDACIVKRSKIIKLKNGKEKLWIHIRYIFNQSNVHLSYFDYMRNCFINLMSFCGTHYNGSGFSGPDHKHSYFSIGNPFIDLEYNKWYEVGGKSNHINGKNTKIVPNLKEYLNFNMISVCVAICDDGSKAGILCTMNFTFQENNEISKILEEKFKIKNHVISRKLIYNGKIKKYPAIYIYKSGRDTIVNHVISKNTSIIPVAMEYKFYTTVNREDCEKLNLNTNINAIQFKAYLKPKGLHYCHICNTEIILKFYLHYSIIHLHNFECQKCGCFFGTFPDLNIHQKNNTNCVYKLCGNFICNICDLTFRQQFDLDMHMFLEHKNFNMDHFWKKYKESQQVENSAQNDDCDEEEDEDDEDTLKGSLNENLFGDQETDLDESDFEELD